MRFEFPEDALEPRHPTRLPWSLLGKLDLSGFGKGCDAVEGAAGRSLKSPRMLLALWLYSLSQAEGYARLHPGAPPTAVSTLQTSPSSADNRHHPAFWCTFTVLSGARYGAVTTLRPSLAISGQTSR